MAKKIGVGIHARLTEIMHEITGTDLGHEFDGQWFLDADDRKEVRATAARLIALVDEYDRLDPLQ